MSSLAVLTAKETANLLSYPDLIACLTTAVGDLAAGTIRAPERQVVPMAHDGVMLSMPSSANDLCIHKLVNVVPSNRARELPTIHGVMAVYDGASGRALCILDGPTVTARRTAAISMLGLARFLPAAPQCVALIGTGAQADGHVQALAALYPGMDVAVIGRNPDKAQAFLARHRHVPLSLMACAAVPDRADAVITLTTSPTPVYDEPARPERLVIGVGAFKPNLAEISPAVLHGSLLYVDDLDGARHEAGDLIQAGIDWDSVKTLAAAVAQGVSFDRPIVFKTVGCAAWDLGAARCAVAKIK